MKQNRALIIYLFLIGLIIRLVYILNINGGDLAAINYPDERVYYLEGARLLKEQGLKFFSTSRSAWNGPLNLIYIAALNLNIPLVKILNCLMLISSSSLLTIFLFKKNEHKAGVLFFTLILLHIPILHYGSTILTEGPFISCLMLMLYLFTNKSENQKKYFLIGVSCAIATLIRPTLQLYPIFFGVFLLLLKLAKINSQFKFKHYLIFLLGFVILILPVIAKNYYYFGKPVIANGFGAVLYLGNDLRRSGDEPIYSGFDFDTYSHTTPFTHLDFEGDRILLNKSIQKISENPFATFVLTLRKFGRLFLGNPQHYFHPTDNLISFLQQNSGIFAYFKIWKMLINIIVFLASMIALIHFKDLRFFKLISISIIAYIWILHSISFAIPRLGLPAFPIMAFWSARLLTNREALRLWIWKLGLSSAILILGISFYHKFFPSTFVSEKYRSYFKNQRSLEVSKAKLSDIENCSDLLCATGKRPTIEWESIDLETNRNQVIFIQVQLLAENIKPKHRNGVIKIFWSKSTAPKEYKELASFDLKIPINSKSQIYKVVPGLNSEWKDKLGSIKLRLPSSRAVKRLELRSVQIMQ